MGFEPTTSGFRDQRLKPLDHGIWMVSQMVSGCSTLVQFQAVHEIRALQYNQLKAALPSFKLHFRSNYV